MSIDGVSRPDPAERPDRPDRSDRPSAGGGHDAGSRPRAETLTREEYAEKARARSSPIPRDDGSQSRFSVAKAERTLGDTTPSGIGLKPTGEQLLEDYGDKPYRKRLDRFLDKAFEDADDMSDAAGHIGEAIDADLRGAPAGPSGHPRSYHATTSAAHDHPQPLGPGVSDTIGSIAVTGVAAITAIRYVLSERQKEHQS
jgi:hypothetical protein